MRIGALDLSLTASGVARWAPGASVQTTTLSPPGLRGVQRLEWILRKVVGLVCNCDLVVVEGYAYARANQAHQIGELGGVIRLALFTRQIEYVEVAPPSLKKVATGKGNAGKELVLVEAVKRLGYDGADNNIADALWLLEMAKIHYGFPGAVELPQKNLEGLDKVSWPALEDLEAA